MTKTALITGASAGIGRELAMYHARKGGHVIVVARRAEALETLKAEIEAEYDATVTTIVQDVTGKEGAQRLYDSVTSHGLTVDFLINNAGFGGQGKFLDRDLDKDLGMIDLNVDALVSLCHLFGADMVKRGSGRILNVGSTAGFMPGPMQATYFATKAFVNSFSQALAEELRNTGVTVTVLCPGYVETEFADVAGLNGTLMVKQGGATAKSVAKIGYDAMRRGQLVVINDWKLSVILEWIVPLLPRKWVLALARKSQSK